MKSFYLKGVSWVVGLCVFDGNRYFNVSGKNNIEEEEEKIGNPKKEFSELIKLKSSQKRREQII